MAITKSMLIAGNEVKYRLTHRGRDEVRFMLGEDGSEKEYSFKVIGRDGATLLLDNGAERFKVQLAPGEISLGHDNYAWEKLRAGGKGAADEENQMSSPMPGKILKVVAAVGDSVKKGDPLVIMEAMKMEHTIRAAYDGKVIEFKCKEAELVEGGVDLVVLKKDGE
jgi:3-methylcrotonyl-CoA carboxylase alpha subunit